MAVGSYECISDGLPPRASERRISRPGHLAIGNAAHRDRSRNGFARLDKLTLSVYDAAYLELAVRLALPLASCDHDLCEAAKRAGVPVIATK
jgi:hypothetical protein